MFIKYDSPPTLASPLALGLAPTSHEAQLPKNQPNLDPCTPYLSKKHINFPYLSISEFQKIPRCLIRADKQNVEFPFVFFLFKIWPVHDNWLLRAFSKNFSIDLIRSAPIGFDRFDPIGLDRIRSDRSDRI